jgi:hypothetical protein
MHITGLRRKLREKLISLNSTADSDSQQKKLMKHRLFSCDCHFTSPIVLGSLTRFRPLRPWFVDENDDLMQCDLNSAVRPFQFLGEDWSDATIMGRSCTIAFTSLSIAWPLTVRAADCPGTSLLGRSHLFADQLDDQDGKCGCVGILASAVDGVVPAWVQLQEAAFPALHCVIVVFRNKTSNNCTRVLDLHRSRAASPRRIGHSTPQDGT